MSEYRQLFHDAKALKEQEQYFASVSSNYPAPQKNEVLEALYPVIDKEQPLYFVVDDKENIERLFWLQDELEFEVVIVSGKEAYAKADELKERNIPVLASIDLPEKPEWKEKEDDEEDITEEKQGYRDRQMKAYKDELKNISELIEAGVEVGFASNGLKLDDIAKNLKKLGEEGGLSETQILQLLTKSTANILGYGSKLGNLRQGYIANFTVFTKPFTNEKAKAKYSVSDGQITEFELESSK
jgi:imidazolonepropionase-like amidohydrolase